ncbi:hypothetical protein GA0070620_0247 [Micromonospora krabiensis]|uniref:Uncharacterized protein n=1 Tax=Micromonospora krabiensis TaxID=307121 RepID=A0A1C3MWU4_9ACTN|nr:hypothetical protein GA0070620_0247 [Micromonospora krabiensis]
MALGILPGPRCQGQTPRNGLAYANSPRIAGSQPLSGRAMK